jgi:hypothetical protein
VRLALSVVIVSLGQFLMPRVASILLVYYTIIIGPSCFYIAKVRFVMLEFIVVMQVKVYLRCVVIVFLFSKRKISLIYISLLTIS